MGNIISFEERTGKVQLKLPEDRIYIKAFNNIADTYDDDKMVDVKHWNGNCWQSFFDFCKERSEELNVESWDYFATCIGILFNGLEFNTLPNGKIEMKIGHE